MGMISRLGKSKTARGFILGLSLLYAADETAPELTYEALAQDNGQKTESLLKEFEPKPSEDTPLKYRIVGPAKFLKSAHFFQAGNFPGMRMKVAPLAKRLFRNEEPVHSVPEHLLNLFEKAGYKLTVNDKFRDTDPAVKGRSDEEQGRYFFIEDMKDAPGACFSGWFSEKGTEYRFSIPLYRRTSPPDDMYVEACETWHSVQDLACNECYKELDKRLRNHGYGIVFPHFDEEEQTRIAGISILMDEKIPHDAVIKNREEAMKVYKRMQDYRIPAVSG